jgi:aminoglycoside phosphotransferase (APT) family kinase protein
VFDRVPWPLAHGELGLARWSLEAKAPGRHPRRVAVGLWRDCLAFLIALHRLGCDGTTAGSAGLDEVLRSQAQHVGAHADGDCAAALERIASDLAERLATLPLGWAHGDFWAENLLVDRGGLGTVVDWDWAEPHGLPALDLMDLIALSRRRIRDVAPGQRLLEMLWPLTRAGGDERLRTYCAAVDVPADARTLEALAVAYWLDRTARDLRPFADRSRRSAWLQSNLRVPLAALEAAGW